MKKYNIVTCRGCGKKFKIYPFQIYDGDQEYCRQCNSEAKRFAKEVLSQNLEEKMACPKCGGKITPEKFHTEQGLFDGWRCIMCGDVFDELVLEHRKFQKGELLCPRETISSDQDLVIDVDLRMEDNFT